MKPDDQRPNPVEEYMQSIVSNDTKPGDKIKLPKNGTEKEESRTEPLQSPITEEAFEQRKAVFDPTGRVEHIMPNETRVADVRRHPFGLVVIYFQFILATVLAIGLIFYLLPSALGINDTTSNLFIGLLSMVMSVLGLIFLILATRIYKGNQLIVTDKNVTQVQQIGLFNRRISELTMANIEDVTANITGVFGTIFNFGTIVIETAGEQNNFTFKYCPNPNAYAKAIQDARSYYIQHHGSKRKH